MGGASLRDRNRAANMAEVQRVAIALMRRSGYENVTVTEVADAAGVSPATVYRYFGTKQALVLSGDGTNRLGSSLRDEAEGDARATPVEIFRRATATMLAEADREMLLTRLQLVFADPSLAAAFEHDLLGSRHEVAALFAAHRRATGSGVRDVAMAGALLGMLVAILDRWQRSGGEKSLAKMLDKSLALVQ